MKQINRNSELILSPKNTTTQITHLCFQSPPLSSKAFLKIKTFSPLTFLIQWEMEEILISDMIIGSKILLSITFSLDHSLMENFQKPFPPSYALQTMLSVETLILSLSPSPTCPIWSFLQTPPNFYNVSLQCWLYSNATNTSKSKLNLSWNSIFLFTLRVLWLARNNYIFNNYSKPYCKHGSW